MYLFAFAACMASCKKEKTPEPLPVPPATVLYQCTDSMKIAPAYYAQVDAGTRALVDNKQYVNNNDNAKMSFSEINGNVILRVINPAPLDYEQELTITFINKTAANITGTYQANNTNICIKFSQSLVSVFDGKFIIGSAACEQVLSGSADVQYDAATQTMSGKITDVKYPFGIYVPLYFPGNTLPSQNLYLPLTGSGSSRNQKVIFKNIARK